jgi:hypothetical protein
MALSKTVLRDLMDTKLAAINAGFAALPAADRANIKNSLEALADAIISHIQTAAVVSSTVAVTSVSGVTTGVGVSGPGAGTATGTIG